MAARKPMARQVRKGADAASRIGRRDQVKKLLERLAREQHPTAKEDR